ncbi:V-type proton ATPase subunit S1-like [Pollicipes pollicipes]|uniref:V-type proton ATPase subunit S1-like n=1 Tax=Pollicipes pollicipes TaxID=41117 RepID=UPI001884A949|nr:V-type proton ATPase subunit S1-like [Pollicipes pollicipes]
MMSLMKIMFALAMASLSMAERNAPVLVWESTMLETKMPELPALPALSNSQLQNLLDSMDAEALVMFVMNELNVEDFSGYPEALSHLQQEFESSQSAFTPSMADPSQVPALLSTYARVTVDLNNLSALKLAPAARKTLFLVYLNDKPGADRATALRQADAAVSQVLTKVKSLTGKYSAVLTGKHTTMGGETEGRATRSLKAAAADEPGREYFFDMNCIYIYTSAPPVMRFTPKDSTDPITVSLNASLVTSNSSSCDGAGVQTATIVWESVTGSSAGSDYDLSKVTLTYTFLGHMSKREGADDKVSAWLLTPVTLLYSGSVGGVTATDMNVTLDFAEVYAPSGFSYHCTSRKWAAESNSSDANSLSSLELPDFQVQAFMVNETSSFGRAWDCTPFFTIPIWSGLFLSLIMLVILVWSLAMLASVPTMDRFDDPRGQPLHVPTAE